MYCMYIHTSLRRGESTCWPLHLTNLWVKLSLCRRFVRLSHRKVGNLESGKNHRTTILEMFFYLFWELCLKHHIICSVSRRQKDEHFLSALVSWNFDSDPINHNGKAHNKHIINQLLLGHPFLVKLWMTYCLVWHIALSIGPSEVTICILMIPWAIENIARSLDCHGFFATFCFGVFAQLTERLRWSPCPNSTPQGDHRWTGGPSLPWRGDGSLCYFQPTNWAYLCKRSAPWPPCPAMHKENWTRTCVCCRRAPCWFGVADFTPF
jgi:hypothetical protein